MNISESAMDAFARGAANTVGLLAIKSQWRANTIDNHGGFMVIEPNRNFIVGGSRFELSAQDVIDFCEALGDKPVPDAETAAKYRLSQSGKPDQGI
jgi:hypothetical protein